MYNILTCDDEQIVIDSLQFIIKKNFEGQINLFSALSGSDALAIASREKIDIIFMDINMPGMSGLETINCIMNLKPDTVIIVLSAFDKFQYAQEAMNLGAYKYITKPVNRNIVIQTVRNAMNLVDERRGKNSEGLDLQKKLDTVSPMVESDFIYSCMFSNDKNEDLSSYLEYFNLDVANYFFTCIEVPHSDSKNQFEFYSGIRKMVAEKYKCLMGSFMANRLVMFFCLDKSFEAEDLFESFHQMAKNIYAMLSLNISQKVRMGVSRISSELSNVTVACKEALNALNGTSPNGELLFAEDMTKKTSAPEKINEIRERIYNRLRIGDSAGVKFLAGLFCSEQVSAETDIDRTKSAVFELLVNVRNITKELNPVYENTSFDSAFAVLAGTQEISVIQDFLTNVLVECASAIASVKEKRENPLVKKTIEYIEKNMSQNFSLEDVAASVGVSPFYMSKLFKEEMGETFINYVTDKRLDKTKKLLAETDLSIKEIAGQTGYSDQNYFSRQFKNKFGISPTDFRNTNNQ
ncbi:MAG: AraC family transcriptional regulator [Treponema sp.]|nr:AraC family transcriptional regulator [Spirochaetia bacterium]MDD7459273.1 AraC family transcriptional regulator [Spirochaetales bacterium]MDY5811317.1 AraC family transcriptional regulator [Treponema sp.]